MRKIVAWASVRQCTLSGSLGSVEADVERFRNLACEALVAGRPMVAYDYAQAWISHGGVRTIGPWLVSVAHMLQVGQPRNAVHAADLALKNWIGDDARRAVIRYVRGEVIRRHLRDPKTAQADLDDARERAPVWLRADAERAAAVCREEASVSRKRKPSVGPAPDHVAAVNHPDWSKRVVDLDGPVEAEAPFVWRDVKGILVAPDPRVPTETRWKR
jgi:hypothetical protein